MNYLPENMNLRVFTRIVLPLDKLIKTFDNLQTWDLMYLIPKTNIKIKKLFEK